MKYFCLKCFFSFFFLLNKFMKAEIPHWNAFKQSECILWLVFWCYLKYKDLDSTPKVSTEGYIGNHLISKLIESDDDQSMLIETSSCNLQFFFITNCYSIERISHGVTASCLHFTHRISFAKMTNDVHVYMYVYMYPTLSMVVFIYQLTNRKTLKNHSALNNTL